MDKLFSAWKHTHHARLSGIERGDHPKALIEVLSESLLEAFGNVPLLDVYDIYQHLMNYWVASMQDDLYLLVGDGWDAGRALRELVPTRDKKNKPIYAETHDFVFDKKRYKADLIPPALIVAHYFAAEQAALELLAAAALALEQQSDEMKEEHNGDDGLLTEAMDDGKFTSKGIKDRLKEIKGQRAFDEEREVLQGFLTLLERATEAGQKRQCRAVGAGSQGGGEVSEAQRKRDQAPGGRRQMAGCAGWRRSGRTGTRQP